MYPLRQAPSLDADEQLHDSSLLDVIDVLRDSKWLIAAITCLGLAAALVYVAVVPPSFEATTLIQVEEGKPGGTTAASAYTDAAMLFESRSPAVAEISILRSGLVLGDVVDRLGLDIVARPKYLPLIGEWLARRATGPSKPTSRVMPGYVHGNESIRIGTLAIPREAEEQPFSVTLTQDGYDMRDADGRLVLAGKVGKLERFDTGAGESRILVAAAVGRPGAEFLVERRPRGAVIDELQRRLKIEEQGKQSGVLRMRLAGSNPEMVANTLNEIAKSYVRQNLARKTAEAEKALAFVENMLPDLRAQIIQAEGRLTRFRNQYGALDVTTQGKLALEQSVRLQTGLSELESKRKDLANTLFGDHPSIRSLDAQISSISAELGNVNRHIKLLPGLEQDLLGLSRELKVKSELYVSLLNSAQQIHLAKEGRVANVRVVDAAWPSHEPAGPKAGALLAAGTTAGVVVGVLLALLRNGVRRGVQDPDAIEHRTDMSVLTTVPYSKAQKLLVSTRRRKQAGPRVLAIRSPQDPAVESLRSMRGVLQRTMLRAQSNIVLITGPTHGIGKSFTSANLAAVLGAAGRRVLLVDADMRKRRLSDTFGVAAGPGLSDVLQARSGLGDATHRNVVPNVDFIAAGSPSPTPADLLTSRSAEIVLREIAAAYEYVIVDTPPVLGASDAGILAQWAGAVFLIARAEVTSLRELQEAEKRLTQRGIQVDGVIYTGLDVSKRRNDIYSYDGYEYLLTR